MPLENDFIAGLDPTPLGSISAAQLLQMVNQAIPSTKRGMVYFSTVQPDIISNPWLIKYFWCDPSSFPIVPKLFNQNTATWEPLIAAPLSITGGMIADGTITLDKIQPGGAFQLLRTNSTGLTCEWWTLSFPTNSIDVNSLQIGSGIPGQFLRIKTDGSGIEWFTFVLNDYLTIGSLSPDVLQNSGIPGDVLYVQDTAGNVSWAQVLDLIANNSILNTKISPGAPGSYLRTNGTGSGVIWDILSPIIYPHGLFVDITPGTRTFTVPSNVFSLDVEVVGAGGGGTSNPVDGNIGGGGGGYARKILAVTPGQVITYTVGLGGAVFGGTGLDGGDSIFDTTLIATGGKGGDLAGSIVLGGSFSGADMGCEGMPGGTTFPGSQFQLNLVLTNMYFLGGRSGHPLGKVATGTAQAPTLGCGGASAQPTAAAGTAADAGVDGAVIIKY